MTVLAEASRLGLPVPKAVKVRPSVPCPLCGSPMHAQQPLDSLREVSLGGTCGHLLKRAIEAYPGGVKRSQLFAEVWGADPGGGPENPANSISVSMNRVNKVIKPLGWRMFATRSGGGPRYRLLPND